MKCMARTSLEKLGQPGTLGVFECHQGNTGKSWIFFFLKKRSISVKTQEIIFSFQCLVYLL